MFASFPNWSKLTIYVQMSVLKGIVIAGYGQGESLEVKKRSVNTVQAAIQRSGDTNSNDAFIMVQGVNDIKQVCIVDLT